MIRDLPSVIEYLANLSGEDFGKKLMQWILFSS
jgi:hypothetical protein